MGDEEHPLRLQKGREGTARNSTIAKPSIGLNIACLTLLFKPEMPAGEEDMRLKPPISITAVSVGLSIAQVINYLSYQVLGKNAEVKYICLVCSFEENFEAYV